jgi:ACS family sodium-dependent inorganic phosphate cotransporter-like MFS transporter 6/7/8
MTNENVNSLFYIPKRLIVSILTSLGLLILTVIQTNFAITNSLILNPHDSKDIPVDDDQPPNTLPKVNWTSVELGYLNSIFYLGYVLSHIPAGFLVHKFSATKIFLFPLIILFILNLLMPLSLNTVTSTYQLDYYITGLVRFVQGLCAGCAFPASHGIVANWCPPSERGRMGGFIYTGLYAGPVVGFFLGGFVAKYAGHYSIYYASAILGLVWSLLFVFLIYEKPTEHPTISEEELNYIEKSISEVKSLYDENEPNSLRKVPWKLILLSLPVWAICCAHFARGWTFYLLLTNQPAFLNAFGFGVTENGTLGSLPHIMTAIVALFSGFIADYMRLDLFWSTTVVRKIMTCTGYMIEATCLLIMCHVTNPYVGIALLTVGVGSSGLMVSGWHLNHQDLSPRYASVLAGFTAVIGTTAGIISPIVAGLLTKDQDLIGWRHVFTIASGVLYFASLFYMIFASGELQSWSTGTQREQKIRLNSEKLPSLIGSFEHNVQEGVHPRKQDKKYQQSVVNGDN